MEFAKKNNYFNGKNILTCQPAFIYFFMSCKKPKISYILLASEILHRIYRNFPLFYHQKQLSKNSAMKLDAQEIKMNVY